jgi:hypothetical protein
MPTVSNAQENSFRNQRERWLRAYTDAQSMRERFPEVERLVLDMTFVDPSGAGRYSAQMRGLAASAKAFFALACPRTLCLDGGFDLDPLIVTLIRGHRAESNGVIKCGGWVHPTRTDNARCLLQMHYRLEAVYDLPKAGASSRRARTSEA